MQGQAPALYYVVPTGLTSCESFTGHQYIENNKRRGKPLRYTMSSLRDLLDASVLPYTNIKYYRIGSLLLSV